MVYRVKTNNTKSIELNYKSIMDSLGRKEKAINLTVELGNISPLTEDMGVEHISSFDSPLITPIQISPTQYKIIKDSLVTLVDNEEKKGQSDR